ncbi:hypothetical protein CMQ_4840 [Grosmannia clavigera kw1407]|uniref:Cytoplasmic tRNA 2-thiolation protein 2 n=1 Tax=Grosmannia clavigera (strain kw1407 / UAMH 11150) TaxID=655863 RepID=F0XUR0_GROCL|nr:uncharacterized protein CMQ_4840 [Grosmannia clavigera kw1407]EFW98988.1 hypothetical protein CMQ_4840 [Grosmannia clavigera kw1407]
MALQTEAPLRCKRCSVNDAVLKIRIDHVCSDCYCRFIATKTVKRLEVLNRDTRGTTPQHRQKVGSASEWRANNSKASFLLGLSFGQSSASLVAICEQIVVGRLAKGRDAAFTLHVVHVDTDLQSSEADKNGASSEQSRVTQLLDRWRLRFPRFTFERVPLADVLELKAMDWSLLIPPGSEEMEENGGAAPSSPLSPAGRLRAMLSRLPSASSRQDVLDMLVRRLLIARAVAANHRALLLGCSTTALAERTLAETAKGRGFSLPWQIHDGPPAEDTGADADGSARRPSTSTLLYYPLRELFRKELVTYTGLTQPSLADLVFPPLPSAVSPLSSAPAATPPAVVSHKHLSIEEVMARYFAEVEENYPSVVANVVKTATKLERRDDVDDDEDTWTRASETTGERTTRRKYHGCGMCGMPLDDLGNERWKGEIGELDNIDNTGSQQSSEPRRLCYGCERSVKG